MRPLCLLIYTCGEDLTVKIDLYPDIYEAWY